MKNLNNINDWTDVTEHLKLGEILIASGKINLIQLGMAIDIQKFQQKEQKFNKKFSKRVVCL